MNHLKVQSDRSQANHVLRWRIENFRSDIMKWSTKRNQLAVWRIVNAQSPMSSGHWSAIWVALGVIRTANSMIIYSMIIYPDISHASVVVITFTYLLSVNFETFRERTKGFRLQLCSGSCYIWWERLLGPRCPRVSDTHFSRFVNRWDSDERSTAFIFTQWFSRSFLRFSFEIVSGSVKD